MLEGSNDILRLTLEGSNDILSLTLEGSYDILRITLEGTDESLRIALDLPEGRNCWGWTQQQCWALAPLDCLRDLPN